MYSVDINKLKALQDVHWKWFWERSEKKKITLNLKRYDEPIKVDCRSFWHCFFGWHENDIKKILFASKKEMLNLIDENNFFYKDYKIHLNWAAEALQCEGNSSNEERIKLMNDIVGESFGYKNFENGNFQEENQTNNGEKRRLWNAYAFTTKMEIDVCPYCGRQYTFTLGDGKEEKKGRPQIDHYIPEAEYPFLSCSLYNFIPSCASCNHQKSDKYNSKKVEWRNIPYPYEDFETISKNGGKKLYDNVKFKAFYQFVKNDSGEQTDELCYGIKLRENGAKLTGEMKNADEAFHLEDLYNMHVLELEDIFTRYRIYNKSRLKNILTVIHSALNTSIFNRIKKISFFKAMISAESYRLKKVILGLPLVNNDRKYPLKKFKEDIIKQLDLTCDKMKKGQ